MTINADVTYAFSLIQHIVSVKAEGKTFFCHSVSAMFTKINLFYISLKVEEIKISSGSCMMDVQRNHMLLLSLIL